MTIKDTVNTALRVAAVEEETRRERIRAAIEGLAAVAFTDEDRAAAWRR